MRILHVCDDLPLPAVHGGRVAMANEIRAMRTAGHDTFVLAFHHGSLTPEIRAANEELAGEFAAVRRRSFGRATLGGPRWPYQVASRVAGPVDVAKARAWKPDLVICHHEWTLPAAVRVGHPVVVRAHNDELRYYGDVLRGARGIRRPYLLAEYVRIAGFLRTVRRYPVAEVWFMSGEDVSARWAHVPHMVIPPIMYESAGDPADHPPGRTVLFLGSLDVPHAVRGLEWFLSSAWPRVLARVPDAMFVLAGRRPGARLARAAAQARNVVLVADPAGVDDLFDAARVFVNPVFSGSGVNLKLGEPLRRALPIVTTTVGARGLASVRAGLGVADRPADAAAICARLLLDDAAWREARDRIAALRSAYSAGTVGALLNVALLDCSASPAAKGA